MGKSNISPDIIIRLIFGFLSLSPSFAITIPSSDYRLQYGDNSQRASKAQNAPRSTKINQQLHSEECCVSSMSSLLCQKEEMRYKSESSPMHILLQGGSTLFTQRAPGQVCICCPIYNYIDRNQMLIFTLFVDFQTSPKIHA